MALMHDLSDALLVGVLQPPCMFRGRGAMEGTNPVNKKRAAALSGGAVLAMALSACSSGDDNSEKLDAWAKQVCDAVQPQAKKIEAANAAIQQQTSDNSKPEDVQKTDAQAFQD